MAYKGLTPGYQPIVEPGLRIPEMGLVRSAVEDAPPDDSGQPQAAGVDGTDPRWVGGFVFVPNSCAAAQAIAIGCDLSDFDDDRTHKAASDNPDNVEYQPFAVVGGDSCSALDKNRDRLGRARAQLLATESYQIARELWRGDLARAGGWPNPFLTDPAATDLGTHGPVHALAALEQFIVECLHGQRGMIHCTPYTASLWMATYALRVEQNLLLTALGTIVVADAGYDGSAPDASDPTPPSDINDSANAYATPIVHLMRGTVTEVGDMTSQIDRSVNDWTVFVERPVAATWGGCCLGTVAVDHTAATDS